MHGKLVELGELSGAALHGNLLLVCADEGTRLDVLARRSPNRYEALTPLRLLENEQAEIDLEGLASDGRHVYVVGSHSRVRKKIDNNVSQQANRRRLGEVNRDSNRCHLFRLGIGADGACQQKESLSLQEIFERTRCTGPFTKIPGKENGVDVEGLAVRDGKLYVGFRGPVLRGNYVPVMVLRFDAPRDYELLFVDLAGRGMRDLAAVEGGMLVLGGPIGDGDGSHELYFCDLKDAIPRNDSSPRHAQRLRTIAATAAQAEGTVLSNRPAT